MSEILRHLRNEKVKESLTIAGEIKKVAWNLLIEKGFQEFDTPILMPRTGEVYNTTFDFVLNGEDVMLADSPQVFKMMLALAGYEKYFQFAHCFRDISHESNLHTRLSEFTQIDIELKNTTLDELLDLAQTLVTDICKIVHKVPKITYMEGLVCRETYGEEMKPDLREMEDDISVVFVKHMPLTNGDGMPCHHIFAKPQHELINDRMNDLIQECTESFDIIINGIEVGGGDLRIMNRDLQERMMQIFSVEKKRYTGYLEMLEESQGMQGGGFAIGLERLMMVLLRCENICQTVAFPNFYRREMC